MKSAVPRTWTESECTLEVCVKHAVQHGVNSRIGKEHEDYNVVSNTSEVHINAV